MGTISIFPTGGEAAFVKDYLIWDAAAYATGNNNSGPIIEATLKELGFCGDYAPVSPTDLMNNYAPFTNYASIFVCLGVYPDNYVFGSNPGDNGVGDDLVTYLAFTNPPDTPRIYMEGADTWVFDSLRIQRSTSSRTVRTRSISLVLGTSPVACSISPSPPPLSSEGWIPTKGFP
jgi:hypothetical protein